MKLTRDIMGMPITVEMLGPDATEAVAEAAMAHFRAVDQTFSTYKPGSEISRLNRGVLAAADVSAEVRAVLAECEALRVLSDGYFDIARDGHIDPSGYVKGWAILGAARLLERHGVTRYSVEAGGDIQLRGEGPDGGAWRVGVRNPFEPGKLAKVVALHDGAVATSGTYERGQHIYNPHTGKAVTGVVSLTVIGPTIDRADALATAAFAMGRPGLEWLARRSGYEAMMITSAREVMLTAGFRQYEL